jgi:endonuclease YncB( thermonuclease family)
MIRQTAAYLVGVLSVAGAIQVEPKPPPRGLSTVARVVEVYDGDTVTVQPLLPEMRIRLLDCWAPEIRTTDAAEKRRGFESRDHLRGMLPVGSLVRLHIPTTKRLGDAFTFGRPLGNIWRDIDGDGVDDWINGRQVADGYATTTNERPN